MPCHVAADEEGVAVVTPRATEINPFYSLGGDESAAVEDVAVGLMLGSRGCGDVGIGEALDGTTFKPCSGGSKDEVGGATDVAMLEVETCQGHPCVDGVLVADESAVDEP